MKTYFSQLTAIFFAIQFFLAGQLLAQDQFKTKRHFAVPDVLEEYCLPELDCSYGDGLESFAIADIDNYFTGCSDEGYGDFTWMNTELIPGETYNMYAETGYDDNFMCVWIDFNDDYIFDADEMLVEDAWLQFGGQLYSIEVTIPVNANPGAHRMRAKAVWEASATDPCEGEMDGEIEDYTITIPGGSGYTDVGIVSIDIPALLAPGPVVPKVTVKNFGDEIFTQQVSIINGVDYGTSAFVNDLLPGEVRQISYGEWNAQLGTYTFHAYSSFPDDNPGNDQMFKEVTVEVPNVDPPQDLAVTVEGNTAQLTWNAPSGKNLLGYHVYNNGTRVADTITENQFTDLCLKTGDFIYTVSAVYEIGESVQSDPVEISVNLIEFTILEEDFEIYNTEQPLVEQAQLLGIDYWQCWSQQPGGDEDPELTDDIVFEGNRAMIIKDLNDVALHLGGKTDGKYQVSFQIFVPAGFDGFFGIWKEVASNSPGLEVYFDENETGVAVVTNSGWEYFNYGADTWMEVNAVVDLDNDWTKLYVNNQVVAQAQWGLGQYGEPGPLMLDVIDFYAGTIWGGTPMSYIDNIRFTQIIDGPPHTISLQSGWSGISSFMIPVDQDVETIFQDIVADMVILQDDQGVFWPGQNINTMNSWQPDKGYKIKMQNSAGLEIYGPEVEDKTISLEIGWNLVPVLSNFPANIPALFLGKDLLLAKEVAGCKVFWPEFGIMSLEEFVPGKAYSVLMETPCTIEFPQIEGKSSPVPEPTSHSSLSGTAPFTHTLAVPASAVPAEWVGMQLVATDASGKVFGSVMLNGRNTSLAIFGDDPMTDEKEGFIEGESIIFKIIDIDEMTENEAAMEFDPGYPVSDGRFHTDGISVVKWINADQSELAENVDNRISVFPNPASGIVHFNLENTNAEGWKFTISDLHGRILTTGNGYVESSALDVSKLPAGLYMISIEYQNRKFHQKLMIE